MKKSFRIFAWLLASAALFVSCVEYGPELPEEFGQTPQQQNKYTMTITAGKGDVGTKALNLDGTTLKATWKDGETVGVYNSRDDKIGELNVTDIRDEGATCTLTGGLDSAPGLGDMLMLKFCSPDYGSQDGTLEYIASHCDYAAAKVYVKSVDSDKKITIKESVAAFENQQAIIKFSLMRNDAESLPIRPQTLSITAGTTNITVNNGNTSSTNTIVYVAVPAMEDKPVNLKAKTLDGENTYAYNKPAMTFERGKYYTLSVKMSTAVYVSSEQELNAAIADKAYIILANSFSINNPVIIGESDTQTVTIDLNGNILSRVGGDNLTEAGHVIEVCGKTTDHPEKDGTLIILDNSESKTGAISGGRATNGGGICNYGKLYFESGSISDCKAVNGGGIINNSGATLTMTGGRIIGCRSDAGGGAIVNHGTATIRDCTLEQNVATTRGGAIWSDGTTLVANTTIMDNQALAQGEGGDGGAIHVEKGLTRLIDVTIQGNKSKDAGAIYVKADGNLEIHELNDKTIISENESTEHGGGGITNYGKVNIFGGTLTENKCHTKGAGIWNNGYLYMEGHVVVKNNEGDDIYLKEGKVITTGTLTGGKESIGVNMEVPGVFTSNYEIKNAGNTIHFFPSGNVNMLELIGGEGKMYYSYYEAEWHTDGGYSVTYTKKHVQEGQAVRNICTLVDPEHGGYLNGDQFWFVVDGSLSLIESKSSVTCSGSNVHLILCDGASFSTDGLYVNEGTTLHIYSQSDGSKMGRLTSHNSTESKPGIGPETDQMGNLEIHGGKISAIGGKYAAGIGGREDRPGKSISIYGGDVVAEGGYHAAGIGGGEGGSGENIYIYDGTVQGTGGEGGAGIGGGYINNGGGNCDNLYIYGGTVKGYGGHHAAGIGGGQRANTKVNINIQGGNVTAVGGGSNKSEAYAGGAGIGGGLEGVVSTIFISGGTIDARAVCGGAGIGAGAFSSLGGTITINGGTIVARGGEGWGYYGHTTLLGGGAGIGGGGTVGSTSISGGEIIITGGTITAVGAEGEASSDINSYGSAIGHGGGSEKVPTLTFKDLPSSYTVKASDNKDGSNPQAYAQANWASACQKIWASFVPQSN